MTWMTLTEAAEASGTTVDAIRKRIKRGLLTARKDDNGRTLIELSAEDLVRGKHFAQTETSRLLAEVTRLQGELERAERRVDTLLAMLDEARRRD